jgi:hypothetical protein
MKIVVLADDRKISLDLQTERYLSVYIETDK